VPEPWQRVKDWRQRAEELRRVADNLVSPAKENILHSAEDYERMADELERNLKEQGISAPSS